MGKCVLDLDSLAPDRDTIRIGGKEYEIFTFDDFGLRDNAKLRRLGSSIIGKMTHIEDMEDEGLAEFERDLNAFVGKIISGIAPEIVENLDYERKAAVLVAFWQTVVARGKSQKVRQAMAENSENPIGETPSPDFSGSMAANQIIG